MKRLRLLRHAKSSWDDPALADRDRPLAPRGRKAAKRFRRWLAAEDVRPGLVLCSQALRARQTFEGVAPGMGSPPVLFEEALYHAPAGELLERVRLIGDDVAEVVLIGHNPGLAELCLLLSRPGSLHERVAVNLPTGALATLELDVDSWLDASPGCAELTGLVLPRELS